MPNKSDPNPNQPIGSVPPASGQASVPSVFPQSDLPPLPDFQNVAPDTTNAPTAGQPTSTPATSSPGSAAPSDLPPVISTNPKKKFGGGKLIATILGILILVGGIGAGFTLTQQKQLIEQQAAPSGTVLENETLKVTVIDTGPGNYESNSNFQPGGQTDTRPVSGSTLTQVYTIQNKTSQPHTVKLVSFPYKMYRVGTVGTDQCTDVFSNTEINNFVQSVGGGNLENSYKAFADRFYSGSGGHCYDTPAVSDEEDPSTNQRRVVPPSGPGGLTCSYLQEQNITNCASSQTLTTYGNTPAYLASQEVTLGPNETKQNVSFSLTNNTCGFFQFDHGFQIDGNHIFWMGSEIKFFPCEQPKAPQCLSVKAYSSTWTELTSTELSKLAKGTSINFCVAGSADSGTFDKAQFKINLTTEPETTTKGQGAAASSFCQSYTILSTDTTVDVLARIHHATLNQWVGETF